MLRGFRIRSLYHLRYARFLLQCFWYHTGQALGRGLREVWATWRDIREHGELREHLYALAGVLLGQILEGDRYRLTEQEATHE